MESVLHATFSDVKNQKSINDKKVGVLLRLLRVTAGLLTRMKRSKSMPRRKPSPPHKSSARSTRYWSADVMKHSNALDLEQGLFHMNSPQKIAASLKRSSERSTRRRGTPYQSSMSMLNFYINRAGKTLSPRRKHILERVKDELRKVFGRK
jgi:hypothetical protein